MAKIMMLVLFHSAALGVFLAGEENAMADRQINP
jgi:hypothetical protein